MVRRSPSVAAPAVERRSSLSSLQPIDSAPFRKPSGFLFIWSTILVLWILSLLPWRLWPPAPDLLLLVIVFWCLNEPGRVNMLVAFVFGLLMDVHDGAFLGEQALTYVVVAYGAVALRRRLLRFNSVVQAIHLLPAFVVGEGAARLCHAWLAGEWSGWAWLWSALLTTALWPLADMLLHMPHKRLDDTESGSV